MLWKKRTAHLIAQTEAERLCLNQIRKLTQALIASGSVNILLLAFICYGLFGDGILLVREILEPSLWRPPQESIESTPEKTMRQSLQSFQRLSMEQLIGKLEDITLIENGYRERDLALGYLVWRYHFNFSKALADHPPTSIRQIPISSGGKASSLPLFPGLSQKQFDSIVHFGKTERWPQTSQGLFHRLKVEDHHKDPMLTEAFCLTTEFLTLQRAFSRVDIALDKGELLAMLLQGDWKTLTTATAKLQAAPELFPTALQAFLTEYLRLGSQTAAKLIARQGGRKLDDQTALLVLKILGKSAECQTFASGLLNSPRSDLIWQEAQRLGGERLAPEPILKKVIPVAAKDPSSKVYVVQTGDSLWKISKLFHVDINKLKAYNSLSSDLVRPGFNIRIP